MASRAVIVVVMVMAVVCLPRPTLSERQPTCPEEPNDTVVGENEVKEVLGGRERGGGGEFNVHLLFHPSPSFKGTEIAVSVKDGENEKNISWYFPSDAKCYQGTYDLFRFTVNCQPNYGAGVICSLTSGSCHGFCDEGNWQGDITGVSVLAYGESRWRVDDYSVNECLSPNSANRAFSRACSSPPRVATPPQPHPFPLSPPPPTDKTTTTTTTVPHVPKLPPRLPPSHRHNPSYPSFTKITFPTTTTASAAAITDDPRVVAIDKSLLVIIVVVLVAVVVVVVVLAVVLVVMKMLERRRKHPSVSADTASSRSAIPLTTIRRHGETGCSGSSVEGLQGRGDTCKPILHSSQATRSCNIYTNNDVEIKDEETKNEENPYQELKDVRIQLVPLPRVPPEVEGTAGKEEKEMKEIL